MFGGALRKFQNETKHPTIKGQSDFKVKTDGQNLLIITSGGKVFYANQAFFDKAYKRYYELDEIERRKTSSYTDPEWRSCPNRIFSPYIASIIHSMQGSVNGKSNH